MMMRKLFSVALMAAIACAVGFASRDAQADVTVDLFFTSSQSGTTGVTQITVTPPDSGTGCPLSPGTGYCMAIVLTVDSDELTSHSFTVSFDTGNGLDASAIQVFQPIVNMMDGITYSPLGSPMINSIAGTIGSWAGNQSLPSGPPALPAGTYRIGTIVWDTSAITGTSAITPILTTGQGFNDGNKIPHTAGEITLNGASINVVPEPGTASLLGLGLAGLLAAGRRSRK